MSPLSPKHKSPVCVSVSTALLICFVATLYLTPQCEANNMLERTLVRAIDIWDAKHSTYNLFGGWMQLKRSEDKMAPPEKLAGTARKEEDFLGRVSRFLGSHQVEMTFPKDVTDISEERSSKLKRFLIPFVVLLVLKKSIEVPIFLGIVSLLAFKGLGAGLISLMLSGATALKSLLEHHSSSKVSYEVVPQGHWSRSTLGDMDYPNLDRAGYQTIPNPGA